MKEDFFKRIWGSKIFFLAILVLIFVILVNISKIYLKNYQIKREIKKLEKQISVLEKREFELKNLINYLNSETFLEEEARIKFGLGKEGESLVIIKGDEGEEREKEGTAKRKSNPFLWWDYFFGQRL